MIEVTDYLSPVGKLHIGSHQGQLCLANWAIRNHKQRCEQRLSKALGERKVARSDVNKTAIEQLEQYFAGERQQFDLPIKLVGTEFQQKVWQALQQVEFGQCASYAELAGRIGQPTAFRAVANANGANVLSIIVPCHRIIGSNGKLTGYAGGLYAKRKLLELEGLA
ncbi:methylated-DNA--[protein]-cysteine S-methyltransferase [Paraferrimonas sp. SM1919]|uniref:methylated-DNA--[protein]-cysteine S-methyltransferase n=1 Tax=Paraferrimonas sp. SM1919 TaxID=2662263 RepID=UPI0013CF443D|nr:methylated-DNA--[protein]-cysteine S-methyltransferase [Paraferrimonas sp. SM1919]